MKYNAIQNQIWQQNVDENTAATVEVTATKNDHKKNPSPYIFKCVVRTRIFLKRRYSERFAYGVNLSFVQFVK